jgi:hypothetical protein
MASAGISRLSTDEAFLRTGLLIDMCGAPRRKAGVGLLPNVGICPCVTSRCTKFGKSRWDFSQICCTLWTKEVNDYNRLPRVR